MSMLQTAINASGLFLKDNKIVLIVGSVIVGIIGTLAVVLYLTTQQLQTVDQRVGKLQATVEQQRATIDQMTARFQEANRATADLSQRFQEIHTETSQLAKRLATINLGAAVGKNPAAVQAEINRVTQETLRDLEAITDPSRLLQREQGVTK